MTLTIVVCRVLVGRTRVLDEGEVGQHLPPLAVVHQAAGGQEQDLGNHGQDFVGWWLEGHDDNTAAAGPLPEVLDQEEGVEDVHAFGGLVEDNLWGVKETVK